MITNQQLLNSCVAFLEVDSFDGTFLTAWLANSGLHDGCCSRPYNVTCFTASHIINYTAATCRTGLCSLHTQPLKLDS